MTQTGRHFERSSMDRPSDGLQSGILLVGHGTREQIGQAEFLTTARLVAQLTDEARVEPAFLEFAKPSIGEAFERLVERGCQQLTVVPVLLFAAGHAKRDIPALAAKAAARHPGIDVRLATHLGCHPLILQSSKARFDEALTELGGIRPSETALILVGRGSSDEDAIAEMGQFVGMRQDLTPVARVASAFVALAEPRLETLLAQAAGWGVRRVVVQPHLLFGGALVQRITNLVQEFATRYQDIEWLVTSHLGPSELLARAILDRANQAASRVTAKIGQPTTN